MGKEVTWSDVGLFMSYNARTLAVTLSSPSYYITRKIPLLSYVLFYIIFNECCLLRLENL